MRTTLVDVPARELRLTGTHVGCEHGVCGACTVLVDGEAVRGCLLLAVQADGAAVETVESLAPDPEHLNRCRPSSSGITACSAASARGGILMSLTAALRDNPRPERGRDPRDAGRPSLPLHRLPGHGRRRAGAGAQSARASRAMPAAAHARGRLHRRAHPAPRGRAAADRARHLRRRPRDAGRRARGDGAEPPRPRPRARHRRRRPRGPCPACWRW